MQPPQPPHTDAESSPAFEPDRRPRQPSVPSASTASRGRSPRYQRLGWAARSVVAGIVIILLATVLAHLALGVPLPFGLSDPPPVPASWSTYRDPASLFSIRLPSSWTVRMDSSTGTFGDPTGSATETDEYVLLSAPALGAASPWVAISATPIRSDFERHWYCQAFPTSFLDHFNFFNGLPAQSDPNGGWLLETAHAHFQIDAAIRPDTGIALPPTPMPLPQDTAAADQTLIDTILGSFQPTDPHALSCP